MMTRTRTMTSENNNAELSDGVWVEDVGHRIKDFENGQVFYKNGFVRLQPSGVVMPREFASFQKMIAEFRVRPDDVWVASFPKCGTTWTQV